MALTARVARPFLSPVDRVGGRRVAPRPPQPQHRHSRFLLIPIAAFWLLQRAPQLTQEVREEGVVARVQEAALARGQRQVLHPRQVVLHHEGPRVASARPPPREVTGAARERLEAEVTCERVKVSEL